MNPLLGWIPPTQRTNEQHDAHAQALARHVAFGLPFSAPPKGTKLLLTDSWKAPEVVADIGFEFNGFHQLTGSCVGASAGNACFTLSAIQRRLSQGATVAFVPFWPFAYGRTRSNEGDRGQGEGAMDSVMGQTLHSEGVLPATDASLPQFQKGSDGLLLTESLEMKWSDGAASVVTAQENTAKQFPVGSVASLSTPDDIAAAIVNGYPVLDGCELYAGHGSIRGNGDTAYVTGRYDGRGGHSTCFLGYWNHPNDGELYLYSNQWPTQTYPQDPAGGGRCCVWLPRSEVEKLFSQYGGDNGETMALSHLTYFPAQPKVIDWAEII